MEGVSSRRRKIALWGSVASAIVLVGVLGAYFSGNQGYALGTESGYANGYGQGHNDGYDEGYDAGYGEGENAGYERGYDDGAQTRLVPKITMTDQVYDIGDCFWDYGKQKYVRTYAWRFNLVNTGEADGFARVSFTLDGSEVMRADYFVPTGSQATKTMSLEGPGSDFLPCPSPVPGIALLSVWKP